jgi:hypothetical protein
MRSAADVVNLMAPNQTTDEAEFLADVAELNARDMPVTLRHLEAFASIT